MILGVPIFKHFGVGYRKWNAKSQSSIIQTMVTEI